ncbi:MAG: leucine-rich repeat domain-containing protein, partial [Paramuribaculum sp.]|nr:leucine-rich repeat domain-containing protein [Paramuribaculum sp.]
MIYKIVVPEGSSYLYKRAPGWHFYSDKMEESQEPGTIPADDKRFIRNGWMADRIVSSGDSSESIRLLYQTVTGEAKPLTLPSSFEYGGRTLEVTELGDESLIYTPYTELILSPNIRRIGDCPLIYSSISRIRGIERVEELGRSVAICAALREFKLPRSINKLQGNMFFFGGSPRGCFDLIELHEDVSHIESHTFYNVSVRNLVCHNPVPPTTKEYSFIFDDLDILDLDTLHVPGGSIEAYREAPGWREFKEIVAIGPADVKDAAVNAVPEVASDGLAITVRSEGKLSVEVVDISGRV